MFLNKVNPAYKYIDFSQGLWIAKFKEENHLYSNGLGPLTSMSSLVKNWQLEYLGKFNSIRRALREYSEENWEALKKKYKETKNQKYHWSDHRIIPELFKLTPKEVHGDIRNRARELIVEWRETGDVSSEYGTDMHNKFEDLPTFVYIKNQKFRVINRPKGNGYENRFILGEILKRKENLFIVEAFIIDPITGIGGQIDKLPLIWTGTTYIALIGDYKSDEEMEFDGFWDALKFENKHFKRELSYFEDTNYWHYTIKMNGYAMILANLGINTMEMYLWHIPNLEKRIKTYKKNQDKKIRTGKLKEKNALTDIQIKEKVESKAFNMHYNINFYPNHIDRIFKLQERKYYQSLPELFQLQIDEYKKSNIYKKLHEFSA